MSKCGFFSLACSTARALCFEQAHGVGAAAGRQMGEAEIERSLRADADIEAHGRLGIGIGIARRHLRHPLQHLAGHAVGVPRRIG